MTSTEELIRESVAEWLTSLPLESVELSDVTQAEWDLLYRMIAANLDKIIAQREQEARLQEAQYWQSHIISIDKGFESVAEVKSIGYDRLKDLAEKLA